MWARLPRPIDPRPEASKGRDYDWHALAPGGRHTLCGRPVKGQRRIDHAPRDYLCCLACKFGGVDKPQKYFKPKGYQKVRR